MNILDLIQNTLRDIDENQVLLSSILNKCLRIAINIKDAEEIIWLSYNVNNFDEISQDKKLKTQLYKELILALGAENAKIQWKLLLKEYIRIRSIDTPNIKNSYNNKEKGILGLSVSSIENRIQMLESSIKNNTLPDGLHSLDLYFKLDEQQKVEFLLQNQLNATRDILSQIKIRAYSKLVDYERLLSQKNGNKKPAITNNKNIFIIHGHNEARWRELKSLILDDFLLNPIILNEQPDKGKTIIEKFEYYAEQCCYAFAIFTPDDIVEKDGKKYFQARPNVIYELGWFTAFLGRNRVCILLQEGSKMDIFSDFQGVIQKRFYKNIKEKYREIQLELKDCEII